MADTAEGLPVPSPDNAELVVAAPGEGPGYWAGGPPAQSSPRAGPTGSLTGYDVPAVPAGVTRNVIARSDDGISFETVTVLERGQSSNATPWNGPRWLLFPTVPGESM